MWMMREGDGYYLSDFSFEDGTLSGEWSNGEITYKVTPEQLQGDFHLLEEMETETIILMLG